MIHTEYYSAGSLNNQIVGDFVSIGIWGEPRRIEKYASMAVLQDGKLIAGTLYHNYYEDEGVVELSSFSLSKLWLTRKVLNAMFSMPFDRLGCQLVVTRVSERNTAMCDIMRRFGFSEVLIPRLRGRDHDEYIFSYTDDQWASSNYREAA